MAQNPQNPQNTDKTDKKTDILELAPETRLPVEDEAQKGFLAKLKRGLFMTHSEIIDKMSARRWKGRSRWTTVPSSISKRS